LGASSFSSISGATSASYTTPPTTTTQNGTKYEAVFTNAFGSKTTNVATLTVNAPACSASPAVEMQPANQTVTAPAAATFTVKEGAVPANCSAAAVQWQVSANKGSTWSNVSGATTATLQINPTSTTESGRQLRAVLTNAHGATNSNPATLTVNAPACSASPSVETQPTNQTVTAPNSATFQASASTPANCASPKVQWYSEASGASSFSSISGATSASYTTPPTTTAQNGTKYEAVFTNAFGSKTTNSATLTVNPAVPTPTVSLVYPNRASAGSIILIFGTNFRAIKTVDFGSTAAPFLVLSPNIIIAQVPNQSSGTVDVTVHTTTLSSPTTSADKFTFVPGRPSIFGFAARVSGSTTGLSAKSKIKAHLTSAELKKIRAFSHGKLHPKRLVTLHG
jgi:hypothetical protein